MAKLAVDQTLRKAKAHAKQGDMATARQLYETVLEAFPGNTRAQQGLEQLAAGVVPKPNPQRDTIETLLVRLYSEGHYIEVAKRLPQALKAFPDSAVLWSLASGVHCAAEEYQAAQMALLKVISLNPNDAQTHFNLAQVCEELGQSEPAILSYREAIRLDGDFVEAYRNLSALHKSLGQHDEAEACDAEVRRLEPLVPDVTGDLLKSIEELAL